MPMDIVKVIGYWLLLTSLVSNIVSTPYKGEVVLHPTALDFRAWPKMSLEGTHYSLQPPLETRVLLLDTLRQPNGRMKMFRNKPSRLEELIGIPLR